MNQMLAASAISATAHDMARCERMAKIEDCMRQVFFGVAMSAAAALAAAPLQAATDGVPMRKPGYWRSRRWRPSPA
jgi:hypothetical protein